MTSGSYMVNRDNLRKLSFFRSQIWFKENVGEQMFLFCPLPIWVRDGTKCLQNTNGVRVMCNIELDFKEKIVCIFILIFVTFSVRKCFNLSSVDSREKYDWKVYRGYTDMEKLWHTGFLRPKIFINLAILNLCSQVFVN